MLEELRRDIDRARIGLAARERCLAQVEALIRELEPLHVTVTAEYRLGGVDLRLRFTPPPAADTTGGTTASLTGPRSPQGPGPEEAPPSIGPRQPCDPKIPAGPPAGPVEGPAPPGAGAGPDGLRAGPVAKRRPETPPVAGGGVTSPSPIDPAKAGTFWTASEVAQARRILRAGGSTADVARALRRSAKSCSVKLPKLKRAWAAEAACAETKAAGPAPEPAPAHPPPPPVAEPPAASRSERPPELAGGATHSRRDVRQRLDALPPSAFWTPARDLALTEALMRGTRLPRLAAELKTGHEDCLARWRQLLPEPTIEGQALLVAELRERAGG